MTARLEVADATVRFGDRTALSQVDLTVAAGEVVAVLGPSGSGKSTLLRCVAGLQRIDGGAIRLDGRDLAGVPVHQRGIGLMFQDHALFPHRDVGGNVAFGLRMQRRPAPEVARRVAELLDLVGLPGTQRRPIHELSGGEQQRVALARALAPAPSLLLLDEPLGALDRTLRERLVGDLRRLFTELALTVVAVTHDQGEAFALADRVAVLDEGLVLQAGPPAEVWSRPANRRVAVLLGLTNLIDGTVADGWADTAWGRLTAAGTPDGAVTLLVQPGGVLIDPTGPLRATVRSSTFRGVRSTLELDVGGSAGGPVLQADISSTAAPMAGEQVTVRIDPSAVIVLAR